MSKWVDIAYYAMITAFLFFIMWEHGKAPISDVPFSIVLVAAWIAGRLFVWLHIEKER